MTKLEKLRDELSAKNQIDKPSFCGVDMVAHKNFCSGWDARDAIANDELAKLKEREAKLVEALEKVIFALQCNIIKHNGKVPTMSDEQVFEASIEIRDQAKQALADHKRMMEGE